LSDHAAGLEFAARQLDDTATATRVHEIREGLVGSEDATGNVAWHVVRAAH
jgi:hypothetical protein